MICGSQTGSKLGANDGDFGDTGRSFRSEGQMLGSVAHQKFVAVVKSKAHRCPIPFSTVGCESRGIIKACPTKTLVDFQSSNRKIPSSTSTRIFCKYGDLWRIILHPLLVGYSSQYEG